MTRSTLARGIVCALLLAVFICRTAQTADNVPRSINEIVALALKHSAELTAQEKDAAAQQSLAFQAGTSSNPTLELQGSSGSRRGPGGP